MKKTEREALRKKLLAAINKVLKDNKDDLKNKTKKAIRKSIKQIVKKTDKKKSVVSQKKNKEAGLNSDSIKTNKDTAVSSK